MVDVTEKEGGKRRREKGGKGLFCEIVCKVYVAKYPININLFLCLFTFESVRLHINYYLKFVLSFLLTNSLAVVVSVFILIVS